MIWYFAPRIIAAVMAIGVLMVLTRVLSPAEFGLYNIVVLAGTAVFPFVLGWLGSSIFRFHSDPDLDGRAISQALGAALRITLAATPVIVAGFFILPDSSAEVFLFGAVFCFAHAFHEIGLSCLRVYEEGKRYAAATLLRPIIGVTLALIFVSQGGGFASAVLGMALGAAASGGYAIAFAVAKSGVTKPEPETLRSFLSFGMPLAIVMSLAGLYILISQSFLAMVVSLEAVGYFAAANMVATRTLRMPMETLMRAVAAKVFHEYEVNGREASDDVLEKYFSALMLLAMPILVFLVFGGKAVANLLFDPEFASEVVGHVRILALYALVTGIQGAYVSFAYTRSKKTSLQMGIMVGSVATHAVISVVLIMTMGAWGASYGLLASGVLTLLAYVLLSRYAHTIVLPVAEMGRSLVGAVVFAPFVFAINFLSSPILQITSTAAGVAAMFLALVAVRHAAAVNIFNRMTRVAKRA